MWFEAVADASLENLVEAVPIPAQVRNPHPLIGALRAVKAGRDGWIDTYRTPGVAHVRVQRSSRDRTIRVLHALVTEAQRRGHTIGCTATLAARKD